MAVISVVRNRRATGATLRYGQGQRVERGGVAVGTTVYSGAIQGIFSGGVASRAYVKAGGAQAIFAGGVDRGSVISAGGLQLISAGKSWGAKINASGGQIVYIRGVAYNPVVSGGSQYIYRGTASGGRFTRSVQLIDSGGLAVGATLGTSSMQYVQYGAAKNTKVTGYSWQYIYSKGRAVNTVVSRAMQSLYKGVASGTQLRLDGVQYIYSAGTAVNTVLSSGSVQYVHSGTAKNTVVGGRAIQMVFNGGLATSTRVAGNGLLTVSGGTARGATISAGGGLYVHGNGVVANLKVNNGGILLLKVNVSMRGTNVFNGVKGLASAGKSVVLAPGAAAVFSGGASKMSAVNFSARGATITVRNAGNQIGSLTTNASTNLTLDLTSIRAGASPLLKMASVSVNQGRLKVVVGAAQKTGSYALGLRAGNGTLFNIRSSGVTLTKVRVGGAAVVKNGVAYRLLSAGGYAKLSLSVSGGRIISSRAITRSATPVVLKGTSDSDVFQTRAADEIIDGKNGRDVAVYGNGVWGKDVINATSGTMTLVFAGVKASDLAINKSGEDIIITRKDAPEQSVTVRKWNDVTHKVVYGGTLSQFSKYAATGDASLKTAAVNEVWKKAGLLA